MKVHLSTTHQIYQALADGRKLQDDGGDPVYGAFKDQYIYLDEENRLFSYFLKDEEGLSVYFEIHGEEIEFQEAKSLRDSGSTTVRALTPSNRYLEVLRIDEDGFVKLKNMDALYAHTGLKFFKYRKL